MSETTPESPAIEDGRYERWKRDVEESPDTGAPEPSPEESGPEPEEKAAIRAATEQDHDRVLYSAAFRRLGDVTQTTRGDPTAYLSNRLTHSLRVEHMGDAIARVLQRDHEGIDLDIPAIRAACLAHDLGHPPFGHIGERLLNRLVRCEAHFETPTAPETRIRSYGGHDGSAFFNCKKCLLADGFEGNAQSFRIATLLETQWVNPGSGFNWTRRSLASVSKYPWLLGGNPQKPNKWGAYDCDSAALDFACPEHEKDLQASVMDWADDIAYAVHDIEDYFRVHLIPLHNYKLDTTETRKLFFEYIHHKFGPDGLVPGIETVMEGIFVIFPEREFRGSSSDLEEIDSMRDTLIAYFLAQTGLDSGFKWYVPREVQDVNAVLKELTWYHVIDNPDLIMVQLGQERLLTRIFVHLEELVLNNLSPLHRVLTAKKPIERPITRRLPSRLKRYLELGWKYNQNYDQAQSAYRAIVDYIASLGDTEAYRVDSVLLGAKDQQHVGSAGFLT